MVPLAVMAHPLKKLRLSSYARLGRRGPSPATTCGRALLYTADHGAAGRGDLGLGRVCPREFTLRALVPAAGVVEIAFHDVHDAVHPRRERRLLLLDGLVCRLPGARCR